jgi:hypothetical protein
MFQRIFIGEAVEKVKIVERLREVGEIEKVVPGCPLQSTVGVHHRRYGTTFLTSSTSQLPQLLNTPPLPIYSRKHEY